MGTYIRSRFLRVQHTKSRGWRVGVGPRILRRWVGRKEEGGWSTGWFIFSKYFPDKRRK